MTNKGMAFGMVDLSQPYTERMADRYKVHKPGPAFRLFKSGQLVRHDKFKPAANTEAGRSFLGSFWFASSLCGLLSRERHARGAAWCVSAVM
jgi:hypothetical protein